MENFEGSQLDLDQESSFLKIGQELQEEENQNYQNNEEIDNKEENEDDHIIYNSGSDIALEDEILNNNDIEEDDDNGGQSQEEQSMNDIYTESEYNGESDEDESYDMDSDNIVTLKSKKILKGSQKIQKEESKDQKKEQPVKLGKNGNVLKKRGRKPVKEKKKQELKPNKYPYGSLIASFGKIGKRGQAKCQKCLKGIELGGLRIGLQTTHFNMIRWKHLSCFTVNNGYFNYDITKIHELEGMAQEDKQKFIDHFTMKSQSAFNQLKRTIPRQALQKYGIDRKDLNNRHGKKIQKMLIDKIQNGDTEENNKLHEEIKQILEEDEKKKQEILKAREEKKKKQSETQKIKNYMKNYFIQTKAQDEEEEEDDEDEDEDEQNENINNKNKNIIDSQKNEVNEKEVALNDSVKQITKKNDMNKISLADYEPSNYTGRLREKPKNISYKESEIYEYDEDLFLYDEQEEKVKNSQEDTRINKNQKKKGKK